jgi:hypothetical protein
MSLLNKCYTGTLLIIIDKSKIAKKKKSLFKHGKGADIRKTALVEENAIFLHGQK